MEHAIKLSLVVIAYRMRRQVMNTLYSLSAIHQRGVNSADYEIIIIENNSDENIDPTDIEKLEGNFRYFLRHETGISPAPAINFALGQCRGKMVGFIIDGARMVTPGVVANVLSVSEIYASPLIAVPGYHLGNQLHDNLTEDQCIDELVLLTSINWKANGYALFDHACYSPGNRHGYFHPLMECTALFCTAADFHAIGGADEQFSLAGGGSLNLHIYRSLGLLRNGPLVLLPGEGNFHQYHGGVTTQANAARDVLIQSFKEQLNALWGGQYKAMRREPILFGKVGAEAQKFLDNSCIGGMDRFEKLTEQNLHLWPDDITGDCKTMRMPAPTITPKLSVIVIVYKMRRQAMNTLYSLSTAYQLNIQALDYEVIVVENDSSELLDERDVLSLGKNFRYFLRHETRPTPVYAINFGAEQARASHICLMIDGARLVTPRLVRYTLDLILASNTAVVATPGYHLGAQDQKFNIDTSHNETTEMALLEKIDWPRYGYKLFDIACFSASNIHGYLHPMMESNCLTCSKVQFIGMGGANEGFQTPGGGSVNLDLYRELVLQGDSRLFVLPGEGTFHQFHGGVTTAQSADLDAVLAMHREELASIRGRPYEAAKREPTLYGAVTGPALRFLQQSSQAAQRRFRRFANAGQNPWPDDELQQI